MSMNCSNSLRMIHAQGRQYPSRYMSRNGLDIGEFKCHIWAWDIQQNQCWTTSIEQLRSVPKLKQSISWSMQFLRKWLKSFYRPIHPPSTTRTCPLTYALLLLAKNTTLPLKSSGTPHRPAGILSLILFNLSGLCNKAVFISVSI